jgi:hypothetical protein
MTDLLKFDGLDDAIIGTASPASGDGEVIVYDGEKILDILIAGSDMDEEEALDYMSFNILGLYAGTNTPIVMWKQTPEEVLLYATAISDD